VKMKATIEFNLPEEKDEHMRAVLGAEAFVLLFEIDAHLRSVIKHGAGGYKSAEELAAHVRSEIGELISKLE
jgi:hypothetical protein